MTALSLIQSQFTRRIRHGDKACLPRNVTIERMKVYEELIFNAVNDAVSQCFPVIIRVLREDTWHDCVAQFIASRGCQTPYFHQIAAEMVDFLKEFELEGYPYLAELAHYEWLELDLEIAKDVELAKASLELSLDCEVVFTPHWRLVHYSYEVETISLSHRPLKPIPSFLLLYRNEEGGVEFIKLNQLSHHLLLSLSQGTSLDSAIACVAESCVLDRQALLAPAISLIEDLFNNGVVLGFKQVKP